ncbi:EAL domain-containing protein [Catenovulum sp. SM1970]|uniref:EAL domain-containing protein n=1 Tax=Marinifaba aquimaris TaxID=2741323 RepID=UPI00157291B1|nr:EAL domain-containing protein [Marinifaba aquimaris]NTS76546.1 EAL domain-containing protein [Marinifaba aquimaris]
MQHILLIDDDDLFAEFVSDAAEIAGSSVTTISNGEQIEQQNCDDYDCIIVDLSIPGYDGVQLLRWLKDHRCNAKIIIASGCEPAILNSAKQLAETYKLNLIAALNKPFSLDTFLKALEFDPTSNQEQIKEEQDINEQQLLSALKEAVDNNALTVYFQPKFNLKNMHLVGFESLARWFHNGVAIPPSIFIPIAEENGLIDKITYQVIDLVLPQLNKWSKGETSLKVAINISARSLNQLDIPDYLANKTSQHGLLPQQIIIELTESALADDQSSSLEILTRLRMKGFNLSIDDFGTGYSSVQQLKNIPFNELKIDRSFITNFSDNIQSRTIINSTIEMAHKLGIKVVAEGIETQEAIDELTKLGCDIGQGFYYGKPMTADDAEKWMKANPNYININSGKDVGFTVCAVDDDLDFITLLGETLAEEFNFTSFTSAQHFLNEVETVNPDIVLLDINLPGVDGFQVCEKLKSLYKPPSVIFISGSDTKEQRLKAYSAGGDDFIGKPLQLGELLSKLRRLYSYHLDQEELKEQGDEAQNMAFQSMTEASQYGSILRFFKESFACQNDQELANLFFGFMDELQLKTCIQFRSSFGTRSFAPNNTSCSPMEENLFEMLLPAGRLYHFKSRTMVNDEHVSFLIKNMPTTDEVLYGRYNDIIAALIEGLEAKWADLIRQRSTNELMYGLDDILASLRTKFDEYEKETHEVIDLLILDVRSSIHVLDLAEEQENYLIGLIETGVERVMELGDNGRDIELYFDEILAKFKQVYQ